MSLLLKRKYVKKILNAHLHQKLGKGKRTQKYCRVAEKSTVSLSLDVNDPKLTNKEIASVTLT